MIRPSAPAHRPGRGRPSRRCGDQPPARLRRGIEEFNRGQFFEQHETLELEGIEEADPVRYLYQGILQVGVGFEHCDAGTRTGRGGSGGGGSATSSRSAAAAWASMWTA
jgi:Domain of unknown function (DUF309)